MSYAFSIERWPDEEWMLEWSRADDGSVHWLRIGSVSFDFSREIRSATFTRQAAVEALWRWAGERLSLPLRIAYTTAVSVAAVAIGLVGDVWLRTHGF